MDEASRKASVLEEAQRLFYHHGPTILNDKELLKALRLSAAEFRQLFADKDDLFAQAMQHDLDRQKREHAALFGQVHSPVERMVTLLWHGLTEMRKAPDLDYSQVQRDLPRTWQTLMQHMTTYSYPQVYQLLDQGIEQGQFRADLNRPLVVKISLELFNLVLNTQVFPPRHYDLAEVFRNIFFYYIRGMCTEEGMQLAAAHFAKF